MGQTESVPQDDIGIIDGSVGSGGFDPCRNTLGWLARCLWDVATSGVDFIVGVCEDFVSK
jgi:hypothetical protein